MINLSYNCSGANFDGEMRHPRVVMQSLGITYKHVTSQTIADSIWYWDCENVPDPLPSYLSVLNADFNYWVKK